MLNNILERKCAYQQLNEKTIPKLYFGTMFGSLG